MKLLIIAAGVIFCAEQATIAQICEANKTKFPTSKNWIQDTRIIMAESDTKFALKSVYSTLVNFYPPFAKEVSLVTQDLSQDSTTNFQLKIDFMSKMMSKGLLKLEIDCYYGKTQNYLMLTKDHSIYTFDIYEFIEHHILERLDIYAKIVIFIQWLSRHKRVLPFWDGGDVFIPVEGDVQTPYLFNLQHLYKEKEIVYFKVGEPAPPEALKYAPSSQDSKNEYYKVPAQASLNIWRLLKFIADSEGYHNTHAKNPEAKIGTDTTFYKDLSDFISKQLQEPVESRADLTLIMRKIRDTELRLNNVLSNS